MVGDRAGISRPPQSSGCDFPPGVGKKLRGLIFSVASWKAQFLSWWDLRLLGHGFGASNIQSSSLDPDAVLRDVFPRRDGGGLGKAQPINHCIYAIVNDGGLGAFEIVKGAVLPFWRLHYKLHRLCPYCLLVASKFNSGYPGDTQRKRG